MHIAMSNIPNASNKKQREVTRPSFLFTSSAHLPIPFGLALPPLIGGCLQNTSPY